jgi:hypothetical protein
MSEGTAPIVSVPTDVKDATKPASVRIADLVEEKAGGQAVLDSVVANLATKTVEQRAIAMSKVMELIEATRRDIRKIKPKFIGYTADNKPIGEPMYDQQQATILKGLNEQVTKYEAAIEAAIPPKSDFKKLMEIANKGKQAVEEKEEKE